ncbi:MAG: hypothetical protein AB8B77_01750 [Alphaproteobacteria bacterium]
MANFLAEHYNVVLLIEEVRQISVNYQTRAALDDKVAAYEQKLWFKKETPEFKVANHLKLLNCNQPEGIEALTKAAPDIIIALGVGRLDAPLLNLAPRSVINVVATDTEHYSGLDTVYWAAFHGDFSNMAACINLILPERQWGSKILKYHYTPSKKTSLIELRSLFTERALTAIDHSLSMYSHFGQFISQPQNYQGRFYYFMPAVLKDTLELKFDQWLGNYWEAKTKKRMR